MAMAQGVVRGPLDLALYADTLSEPQRRALGFRVGPAGRMRCPKKTAFTRLLHGVDDRIIEQVFLRWQQQVLGRIRRLMGSLANAAVDRAGPRNSRTKANTKTFAEQFGSAGGGRERLHALVLAKSPSLSDL